jgi:hypothetical protein
MVTDASEKAKGSAFRHPRFLRRDTSGEYALFPAKTARIATARAPAASELAMGFPS